MQILLNSAPFSLALDAGSIREGSKSVPSIFDATERSIIIYGEMLSQNLVQCIYYENLLLKLVVGSLFVG